VKNHFIAPTFPPIGLSGTFLAELPFHPQFRLSHSTAGTIRFPGLAGIDVWGEVFFACSSF